MTTAIAQNRELHLTRLDAIRKRLVIDAGYLENIPNPTDDDKYLMYLLNEAIDLLQ